MSTNLQATIDALGELKARIADLQNQEKDLRDQIVALGVGAYDGTLFRATVSVSDRKTLDMEAVRAKLTPQFIAAHTNVTEVTTVKLTARRVA